MYSLEIEEELSTISSSDFKIDWANCKPGPDWDTFRTALERRKQSNSTPSSIKKSSTRKTVLDCSHKISYQKNTKLSKERESLQNKGDCNDYVC